jgi:Restriction endonuclease
MKEYFKYKYDDLFNPTLIALHTLGGSGTVNEIEEQVALSLNLSDKQIDEIHRNNITKLSYRLAWARNYLKRYGLLINSARGIWTLTEEGLKKKSVEQEAVKRKVVALDKLERRPAKKSASAEQIDNLDSEEIQRFSWQEQIIEELKKIPAEAFERLCQRLLRELGFQNVDVTGRSHDEGIDGKGILKVGGILSFHVIFQAKRYKGSVSSSVIRDFRGAMIGRADKGIIITTGTFTSEARKEAQRAGTSPIDLIDGNDLAEHLKELKLGVDIELVEKIEIKRDWFKSV